MHKQRLSRFHIQLSENHSPSPEQSNQKTHVWTCGDWPLLLGFVFVEQFLQASVLEALRMGCRSSYCDHIIEGICGGNISKHSSTGLTNHKQAHSTRFASCFMCFLLFCEYIRTAWSTCSSLRNRDTSIKQDSVCNDMTYVNIHNVFQVPEQQSMCTAEHLQQ